MPYEVIVKTESNCTHVLYVGKRVLHVSHGHNTPLQNAHCKFYMGTGKVVGHKKRFVGFIRVQKAPQKTPIQNAHTKYGVRDKSKPGPHLRFKISRINFTCPYFILLE